MFFTEKELNKLYRLLGTYFNKGKTYQEIGGARRGRPSLLDCAELRGYKKAKGNKGRHPKDTP